MSQESITQMIPFIKKKCFKIYNQSVNKHAEDLWLISLQITINVFHTTLTLTHQIFLEFSPEFTDNLFTISFSFFLQNQTAQVAIAYDATETYVILLYEAYSIVDTPTCKHEVCF